MSKLFRNTMWVLIALGCLALLFNLLSFGLIAPALLLPSIAIGAVVAALFLFLLRLSPMWPRSARSWVPPALLWGGGTALGLALLSAPPLTDLALSFGWKAAAFSWAGAYPEEISKATGVLFILLSYRELNRPWHGWIVGACVGLGFEMVENVMYSIMGGIIHPLNDWIGMLQMWGLRLVAGPGLHVLFTAMAGWGIGWAIFAANKSRMWRLGVLSGFMACAFGFHFCWNYMHDDEILMFIQYIVVALVLYPFSIFLILRGNKLTKQDDSYYVTPAA
ncbi:PrsW family intramembrane metalloprotease [Corynebacterium striatum]|uniref:PrsW family intramembrane metalloprotease n=1 Tax=Corynebacterium striatum TaxID=43770 RepID=UPI003B5A10F3